jgi:hypothetical protein
VQQLVGRHRLWPLTAWHRFVFGSLLGGFIEPDCDCVGLLWKHCPRGSQHVCVPTAVYVALWPSRIHFSRTPIPAGAVAWGAPVGIALTIDAPSLATGTGSALYLDGEDAAAIRATIVDAAGAYL